MAAARRVLLGVTGGIAAYKSVYLARRLVETGNEVRVVMTGAAGEFVGAQTFAAVTGHPVAGRLFGVESVSPHTELAGWADLIVVAPATAHTIAKLANGLAPDLLSATLLASTAPVLLAPAMHTEMWEHPAVRRNVARLEQEGVFFVGPVAGPLAGGEEGIGRMAEPEVILEAASHLLTRPLSGWKVLVTAGGTREPIDPVRYIGNRSSGKMGHAVAAEAALQGAEVVLVSTSELPVPAGVERLAVETAEEMAGVVVSRAPDVDVVVMAAAVADFRPADPRSTKLRRADGPPSLSLESAPDILAAVAALPDRPYLVGFAAESGSLDAAVAKARSKGVDLLVANDVAAPGSGFGSDTNQVTLIDPDGTMDPWPLLEKREVARRLWATVAARRVPSTDRG